MITPFEQINHYNPLRSAWFFGLVVLSLLPGLLFNQFMPPWAPQVAVIGLLVVMLFRGLATGRPLSHPLLDGALIVLLLLLPVGLLVTAAPGATWGRTYAFMANVALFWAVAAQRDTPWLHQAGWFFLLLGPLLGLGLLLSTNFSTAKLPFIDREIYGLLPGGWQAFWDQQGFNPNMSGGLLALFFMPVLVLVWKGHRWQQRDLAKFVAGIMFLMLLFLQSRGALLAVLVATVVVTLRHSRRWLVLWAAVVGLLAVWVYRVGLANALDTLVDTSDLGGASSWSGRVDRWQLTLELVKDAPLTGAGLGGVDELLAVDYAAELQAYIVGAYGHAHNLYLYLASEMGLPGLAAHLVLYATLFYLLWQQAGRTPAGPIQALALGLLGTLIVFLGHGLVDAIIFSPQTAIVIWGLLGLMAAVGTSHLSDANEPLRTVRNNRI